MWRILTPSGSSKLVLDVSSSIKTLFLSVGKLLLATLVNDQLDAQFFYLIIRLLQSSTCFEQRRVHHQDVKLY